MRQLRPAILPAIMLLTACAASSPMSATPSLAPVSSVMPSEPAQSAAASTSAPQPTPAATVAAVPIPIDSLAVVTVNGLNVREEPTAAAPIQTIAPGIPTSGQPIQVTVGDYVWVIGRKRVDSDVWYQVALDRSFETGWVSGGPRSDPWLRPFDRETCPDSLSAVLAAENPIKPFSMENLVCFGGQRLSAVVYWLPREVLEVPCPWPDLPPQWLVCHEAVNVTGDNTRQLAVYGTVGREDIRRGRWVTLVGHYDDLRSRDCPQTLGRDMSDSASVAATIVSCRAAFVVDEVNPPPVFN